MLLRATLGEVFTIMIEDKGITFTISNDSVNLLHIEVKLFTNTFFFFENRWRLQFRHQDLGLHGQTKLIKAYREEIERGGHIPTGKKTIM